MERLKGKRALITGGTNGIGLETAHQFLNEGARVAITGKNPATLETARGELGSDVLIIPSDASEVAAQKKVAEDLRQAFGGLDILFVNAGIADLKPVEQWDEAAFDRSFAINVKGPYFLFRRCCRSSPIRHPLCSPHRSTRTSACRTRASTEPPRRRSFHSPAPSRASWSRPVSV